jgi:transcriptional regulator with XRE-family HTH domain
MGDNGDGWVTPLHKLIKVTRDRRGWTQAQFAEAAGLSRSAIGWYETRPMTSLPRRPAITGIAKATGLPEEEVWAVAADSAGLSLTSVELSSSEKVVLAALRELPPEERKALVADIVSRLSEE